MLLHLLSWLARHWLELLAALTALAHIPHLLFIGSLKRQLRDKASAPPAEIVTPPELGVSTPGIGKKLEIHLLPSVRTWAWSPAIVTHTALGVPTPEFEADPPALLRDLRPDSLEPTTERDSQTEQAGGQIGADWDPSPEEAPTLHFLPSPAPSDGSSSFAQDGPIAPANSQSVDIFYGTDRDHEAVKGDYGPRRGHRLRVGLAKVSVPTARPRGSVTRPLKVLWITVTREDPRKHFIVQETRELEQTVFQESLRDAVGAASEHPALLFVHGFNTTFDGALYRAAQLAVDLSVEGPMLAYSWPSAGGPLTYREGVAYDYDRESVRQACDHFTAYLDLIFESEVRQLNILAHSLGNDLVLEALKDRSQSSLSAVRQVVLASPDVDCDVAATLAPKISPKVHGVTLYACDKDIALQVSKGKAGGLPRAGELMSDGYPLIVSGVDSIDATDSTLRLAEFNHNSFVADTVLRFALAELLASGRRPPHERSASITRNACSRGYFWRLQPR